MNIEERPIVFECEGDRLLGMLALPERAGDTGLIIVVGGPQYRVGSHRQFRHVARRLAEQGVTVLRFDYRGMGDSEGSARSFEDVGADIASAVRHFCEAARDIRNVVLWGLCDGASAALLSARVDERVRGLILLNPWVRTEASQAAAFVRHYYARRFVSKQFWLDVVRGRIGIGRAAWRFLANVRKAVGKRSAGAREFGENTAGRPLPDRMADMMERFRGPIGVILSGDDMTAREFSDLCISSPRWKRLMRRMGVIRREIAGANHTFSRREWRDQVTAWTIEWVEQWRAGFS